MRDVSNYAEGGQYAQNYERAYSHNCRMPSTHQWCVCALFGPVTITYIILQFCRTLM